MGDVMVERYNRKSNPLHLSVGDYVYMLKDPTGQGRKLQSKYSGPYVVQSIKSGYLVRLKDPTTDKILKNDVHLDRLKVAYIRAPNPSDYFLPEVRRKADETASENINKDSTVLETNISESANVSSAPVQMEPRRSVRQRRKPSRFRDYTLNSDSDSPSEESNHNDKFYKIRRVLAQRHRNNSFEYLIQFESDAAQNAIWIPFHHLNSHTQRRIK